MKNGQQHKHELKSLYIGQILFNKLCLDLTPPYMYTGIIVLINHPNKQTNIKNVL